MKILLLIILLSPLPVSAVEFEISGGVGVNNIDGIAYSISANHYYYKNNLYIQGKFMSIEFVFFNLGFTGYNIHWVMGIGYANDHENDQNLTGHRQFNLGLFYDIGQISIGWDHISNCSNICWGNKRQELRPNNGHDYLTIKWRF